MAHKYFLFLFKEITLSLHYINQAGPCYYVIKNKMLF